MQNQEQNQSEPQVNADQTAADPQAQAPVAPADPAPTAPADEKKEAVVSAAPRQLGKAVVKKAKSFAEIEAKKQIESVKLWSSDILEAQLSSKVCSEEMKKACAEELKARAEKRKKLLKK